MRTTERSGLVLNRGTSRSPSPMPIIALPNVMWNIVAHIKDDPAFADADEGKAIIPKRMNHSSERRFMIELGIISLREFPLALDSASAFPASAECAGFDLQVGGGGVGSIRLCL